MQLFDVTIPMPASKAAGQTKATVSVSPMSIDYVEPQTTDSGGNARIKFASGGELIVEQTVAQLKAAFGTASA